MVWRFIKWVVTALALIPLFVILLVLFAIEDGWNKFLGRNTE